MAIAFESPRLETGTLLLADISGYTTFLGLVTAVHPEMIGSAGPIPPAYPIMSSLLDVVVDRIAPTFGFPRSRATLCSAMRQMIS